ncbi:PDZ domain-containing protein [Lactobacillus sp. Sy-1]|uniref:PDZ domain-containing protein n=1 Tax=Lactobacillus sp. Sy-1 TaxID=2109645 RepID=UPI001C5B54EC|nr:PDZ domain-containing protein [Lactobacillus sp. Sy-1]MBW1605962.1 PDZ domain-containing protein [Lactobacillus sp. Sy-1]
MQTKILIALVILILQPVLWVGVLRTYLISKNRIQETRSQFRNAIYPRHFEIWQFVINFIILGILGSVVTVIVGPVVSVLWLLIYQVLLLINLAVVPGALFSVEIMVISAIGAMLISLDGFINQFLNPKLLSDYGINLTAPHEFNYVLLVSLFLFGLAVIVAKDGGKFNVPIIERNERQTRIAGYPFRSINVAPLLLFVPGDWIHSLFQYWPVFTLNGHSLAFLLVPIGFGFRMTVFKRQPREVFKQLASQLTKLAILGLALAVASYFFPVAAIPSIAGLLLVFWWLLMHAKSVDKAAGDWYSEVINGVRVIGVEPDTPADKMNLVIGDVILEVNNTAVTNEDEFYQALLKQSTYCRLKLKTRKGQLAIAETAIFSNAPHEIGVILFKGERESESES